MKNKTAILIFANSAQKEVENKSFLSADAFKELNKQTEEVVRNMGLPYFHFSEKEQIGASFGERFSNAIETVFSKGFNSIITVGNDTPHLRTSHLKQTAKSLNTSDLVLGPSKDGGFYLMGIKKEHFNIQSFLNLPWQTSKLQKCIATIVKTKNLSLKFLEVLKDIDTIEDIKVIVGSFKSISTLILAILRAFILTSEAFFHETAFNIKKTFHSPNSNKGSPLVL